MHLKILVLFGLFNFISCWPTFQYYHKNKPTELEPTILNSTNLLSSGFDVLKETKFIVHGFGDNGKISRMLKIKDQFLINPNFDFNIVFVDWEKGAAAPDYFKAADNVRIVGQNIAEFIIKNNLNPSKVHCIGHSLGAHVCGFAGKKVKLNRISGLDPAGPFFKGKPKTERLDKTDAYFVDNIHTDWFYGIQEPIGHKDFYPNGGSTQYGCSLFDNLPGSKDIEQISIRLSPKLDPIDLVACNHMRVPLYYAESINSNCPFTSALCDNYDNFRLGKCRCSLTRCSTMGYWTSFNNDEGKYYLETNKIDPYCRA